MVSLNLEKEPRIAGLEWQEFEQLVRPSVHEKSRHRPNAHRSRLDWWLARAVLWRTAHNPRGVRRPSHIGGLISALLELRG